MTEDQKFEAIKYRHDDQSKLLQFLSRIDHQIYGGLLTIQLTFGGFLSQVDNLSTNARIGLATIDASIFIVCALMLYKNYQRRSEIVDVIKRCNQALKFDESGFYLPGVKINTETKFRPWLLFYVIGLGISVIGIVIILCFQTETRPEKLTKDITIVFGKDSLRVIGDTLIIFRVPPDK